MRDTWAQVEKEYATYQSQASAYGVDITGLTNAYNSLNSYLTGTVKINENTDTSLSVSQKSDYNTRWANWNSETTEFANAVAEKVADTAVDGVQIGVRNLLLKSNVEKAQDAYTIGAYFYSQEMVVGKEYTLVLCYTLGENNTRVTAFQDSGNFNTGGIFDVHGDKVVGKHTFIFSATNNPSGMYFFNNPSDVHECKVHWAVLVEGNKAPSNWIAAPEDIQDEIDAANEAAQAAQEAADAAQSAADAAQADADAANSELNKINSDSVVSPVEKTALKQQQADMQSEYNEIIANANRYGVGTTAYTAAYNSANAALTKYTAASPEYINIGSDYNNIAAYYPQRQSVLNSIAAAAKQAAQDAADAAKDEANGYTDDAVGGIDIGIVNLLKDSDVELGAEAYGFGDYYYADSPEVGVEHTLVLCYTLGEDVDSIGAYNRYGSGANIMFSTHGTKVVEAKPFTPNIADAAAMGFYQFPDGTYGSKVHWAVLVRGNKAPKYWFPSPEDSKMGVENLVSFKRMLEWNGKNKDIAVWGKDGDGVYLRLDVSAMIQGGVAVGTIGDIGSFADCFGGEIKYKANTQYVFSINQKLSVANARGIVPYFCYTDGTRQTFYWTQGTGLNRSDFVTAKGKTVEKIVLYISNGNCDSLVYSLSLIEGNVVPLEIPTSSEDEWRSEVNLVDGGKENTVTASESNNYVYNSLVVPMLKPNTVYTVKVEDIEVLAGSPSGFTVSLYSNGVSTKYAEVVLSLESKSGLLITPNNFTAGEARLLLYSGKYSATAGNSVKYTGISLVEGFYPPQGWTPSQGDTRAEIEATGTETKDSFAQKLGYDSYEDMKYSLGQGMITETGYLNAALIETDKLVVTDAFVNNITINDAFISKLNGWTFDFHSGKVGGFTIADNKLYAGADFGSGAGVYMQSLANNYGFRAYKDASNYVEMFYRTASDWGLKGLAGGSTVFQLGSTNKIGPFVFGENNLTAESVYDSRALVLELTNNIISFKHAMGTIYQKEVYFGAVPDDITYGAHTLLAVVGGDIYHQGTVGEDGRRACRFYTSNMYLRNPRDHRQLIGGDWHYVCYPTQSGRFSFTPNSDGSGEVQINIVETTIEYAVIGSFESQNETVDSRDRFNFCIRRKTSTYFILSYKEIQYTRVYFSYIIAPIYPS